MVSASHAISIDLDIFLTVFSPRSRGSTGRSKDNPEGNVAYASVRRANYFAERLMHILLAAWYLGVYWAIEQPSSSASRRHFVNTPANASYNARLTTVASGAL